MRVLLVSSSIPLRRMLASYIHKAVSETASMEETPNFSQAALIFAKQTFDLILVDEHAEGGSALAFIDNVQSKETWLPLIFIYSGQDPELALEALRRGAQDALPIGQLSSGRLQWTVQRIFHTQELRRQNAIFQKELERSNRELEQFAHSISHDLREPLRKIQSFGTLLAESLQGHLEQEEAFYLERMIDGAERMGHMIHAVLEYGHAGRGHDNIEWQQLRTIIREALEDLELAIAESQADIILSGPFPAVQGDPVRLRQLMVNILSNSIKYRRPDEKLTISLAASRQSDNSLGLQFIDNGQGFDPNHSEKIFTLFQRLETQQGTGGYGIGLALCRRIVESLGGTLTAVGNPDHGAIFSMELPRVKWD